MIPYESFSSSKRSLVLFPSSERGLLSDNNYDTNDNTAPHRSTAVSWGEAKNQSSPPSSPPSEIRVHPPLPPTNSALSQNRMNPATNNICGQKTCYVILFRPPIFDENHRECTFYSVPAPSPLELFIVKEKQLRRLPLNPLGLRTKFHVQDISTGFNRKNDLLA